MFRTKCVSVCSAWLLIGASITLMPSVSNGQQKPTPRIAIRANADTQAKDVNVVNTPGVVVTNPITLAPGASVDIHSSATRLLFQTPAGGVVVSPLQDLGRSMSVPSSRSESSWSTAPFRAFIARQPSSTCNLLKRARRSER